MASDVAHYDVVIVGQPAARAAQVQREWKARKRLLAGAEDV